MDIHKKSVIIVVNPAGDLVLGHSEHFNRILINKKLSLALKEIVKAAKVSQVSQVA
jgi:hypothetical protein